MCKKRKYHGRTAKHSSMWKLHGPLKMRNIGVIHVEICIAPNLLLRALTTRLILSWSSMDFNMVTSNAKEHDKISTMEGIDV